jgi:hypothetical protein
MMQKARKKAKIGDIIEIKTPKGLAYAQYTHRHAQLGMLVRIFGGLYKKRPADFGNIVNQKEKYFIFFQFHFYLEDDDVSIVANEELPERVKIFPPMLKSGLWDNRNPANWWPYDGNRSWYIGKEIPEDKKDLSFAVNIPKKILIEAILKEWEPKDGLLQLSMYDGNDIE